MIGSVLFDGFLHETRKRRKDVDGRVYLLIVKLPIDEDLSFSNVAGKIGNRVGDIVILGQLMSTGMERMGIWVIDPFLPWTLPALS